MAIALSSFTQLVIRLQTSLRLAFRQEGLRLGPLLLAIAISLSALFSLTSTPVNAEGPTAIRLTEDTYPDLAPRVGITAEGEVVIAWQRLEPETGHSTLQTLTMPDSKSLTLDRVESEAPIPFDLATDPNVYVAWVRPSAWGSLVTTRRLGRLEGTIAELDTPVQDAIVRVDGEGHARACWVEGGEIKLWDGRGKAYSVATPAHAGIPHNLAMAWQASGGDQDVLLAYDMQDAQGLPQGVFAAQLSAPEKAVLVAKAAWAPRVLAQSEGRYALFFLAEDGLWMAAGPDWGSHVLIAPGIESWEEAAVALDENGYIHASWIQDGAIWHADSSDWEHTRRRVLDVTGEVSGLDIAVGACQVHVVWSVAQKGAPDVYYAAIPLETSWLQVRFPAGGETINAPVMVRLESSPSSCQFVEISFWLQAQETSAYEQGSAAAVSPEHGLFGPLYSLGVDRDPSDGWEIPLDPSDLEEGPAYRVVALGTDARGRVVPALGGWFTVCAPQAPQAWLRAPETAAIRGESALQILVQGSPPAALASLSLAPLDTGGLRLSGYNPAPSNVYYLGDYPLVAQPGASTWLDLAFDSRLVPDGQYEAIAVLKDQEHQPLTQLHLSPLTVDNVTNTTIDILQPSPGQVVERTLDCEVAVDDADGAVEQVAFYLQPAEGEAGGQAIWLGTDYDGSDGWHIRRAVEPAMDGDSWLLQVLTTDSNGHTTAARLEETFAILGRARPYLRFGTPSQDVPLVGVRRVTVHVPAGYQYLLGVSLYAEDSVGSLQPIGPMREENRRFVLVWDTNSLPDGGYTLLAVGESLGGHMVNARSQPLEIANHEVFLRLDHPTAGAELSGTARLSFRQVLVTDPLTAIQIYCRDGAGSLFPVGQDNDPRDGWAISFDTTALPDGEYSLLAIGTGREGTTCGLTSRVTIRNRSPRIALEALDETLRGEQVIRWEVDHPLGLETTVQVEYSPDGGAHWMMVGDQLDPATPYLWDTREVPDSHNALLRLTADDGTHLTRTTSTPFSLNNTNEPPLASILAPDGGTTLNRVGRIAWQAWDPDGDPIALRLEYRQGSEEWRLLAEPEASSSAYQWDVQDLMPGEDYALRLTCTDSLGASTVDVAEGLRVSSNMPPVVQLLSPHEGARLKDQAVVLWTTFDPENDPLTIDLYYSDDGGQAWLPLAHGLPDAGYYVWQFSFLPSGTNYRLRIVASDGHSSGVDESDEPFIIGQEPSPQLYLNQPGEGEELSGHELISWSFESQEECDMSIAVRAEGEDWWTIVASGPNDGFYLWDTTPLPDGRYALRVEITDAEGQVVASATREVVLSNQAAPAPRVRLLSPQSGDVWWGIREVRWLTENTGDEAITATLYCSADAGYTWKELVTLDGRTGRYLWDTREEPSGAYLLRIQVKAGHAMAQDRTSGVVHVINLTARPPTVSFIGLSDDGTVSPGERLLWAAEDGDGDDLQVILALSDDGGHTWRDLARSGLGTGAATLPDLKCGGEYQLRLLANDGLYLVEKRALVTAVADTCPQLYIDSPAGGEVWSGIGSVSWHAAYPAGLELVVDISLSADDGRTWALVMEDLPNTGTYDLDTRAWPNGEYRLQITARSSARTAVCQSNPFRLSNPAGTAPSPSLVRPIGGEVCSRSQDVQWHVYDPDGNNQGVDLSYSVDGGRTWSTIAEQVTDADSVIWDTSDAPNTNHLLLRVSVGEGWFVRHDILQQPLTVFNPEAPIIKLQAPSGPTWTGIQRLAWSVVSPSRASEVWLEISTDGGNTWRVLAEHLAPTGSLLWDSRAVPQGARVLVRAWAAGDRGTSVDAMDEAVVIRGKALVPDE